MGTNLEPTSGHPRKSFGDLGKHFRIGIVSLPDDQSKFPDDFCLSFKCIIIIMIDVHDRPDRWSWSVLDPWSVGSSRPSWSIAP